VVGPSLFEAVSEFLHGLRAFRAPEDETDCSGADAADHPKNIFHVMHLLPGYLGGLLASADADVGLDAAKRLLDGWRRRTTLTCMDSVRFGRVLGVGTRLAAKTVASAVDAAAAPNPSAKTSGAGTAAAGGRVAAKTAPIKAQVQETGRGLRRGSKRFGEAIWGPFVRLSGVLWLEFTGVFFGLFALSMGIGLWRQRGLLHAAGAGHEAQMRFLLLAGVALLFGYFCVSSFLRAGRRGRQR
jgi:hypothetical protein